MKRNIRLYFIVGLALFSMLFGSGNLIFPPEIGITGGTEWYQGYIAYFLADAVLSICSVFAMLKVDGDLNRLTGTIGPTGSMIINTVCIICIGPLLAIPRNAAVTFEMGISPLFGLDPESRILRLVFSIIFFGVVLLLTIRPSKVVDILGKYLTPILVAAIAILIIIGVVSPAGQAGAPVSDSLIKDGILTGWDGGTALTDFFLYLKGKDGTDGKDGKSAYEVWKEYVASGVADPHNPGKQWDKDRTSVADFYWFLTGRDGDCGSDASAGHRHHEHPEKIN